MDRSRQTETKYLNDETTHKTINGKLFKRLNSVSKELYEVELVKSKIEHREPIIVGFFILQSAKLRMIELYYNFFDKFCNVESFEELEKDTDSLYLALAHDNLYDCIRPSKKAEWEALRNTIVIILSKLMLYKISSLELVVINVKNTISVNQVCSRKNLYVLKLFVSVAKFIVATMPNRISTSSAAKD